MTETRDDERGARRNWIDPGHGGRAGVRLRPAWRNCGTSAATLDDERDRESATDGARRAGLERGRRLRERGGRPRADRGRPAVGASAVGLVHARRRTRPTPEEFEILLCTGGPACRIVGDLDESCQPSSARIEHQDWGTPWTELSRTRRPRGAADVRQLLLFRRMSRREPRPPRRAHGGVGGVRTPPFWG